MSPEQATAGKVDSRSDVFSFGAVLYEMVTGRRAFAGSSTAETLAAVVREQPKPPSEVAAGVPKELDRLILRCLQKDLDRRFQHMVDVKVELNEIKEESDSQPVAAATPTRRYRRWWLAFALGGALLLVAMAFLWWRRRESVVPQPRLEPLTSLRGSEMYPTFSPDGSQLAFAWEGEKGGNWDIYLKMVGATETRRLTIAPDLDVFPSWSPDGRQVAFVRTSQERDGGRIHLVSPVGGSDRKLSEFPAVSLSQLSWSSDARWLAAARFLEDTPKAGIYLIPVLGGEPRRITTAKPPGYHLSPAFSPDGRHLAYVAGHGAYARHVEMVDLDGDYLPAAPPRRLTRRVGWVRGLAWSRDGNSVIYGDVTSGRLWRAWIAGPRPPERIDLAGLGALWPATAVSLDRLAFVQDQSNTDIYRFEEGHSPEGLLVSSFTDAFPSLSPNGRQIAFQSRRAGEGDEIWLANADGSDPKLRGPGIFQGSPRWSPDGRRIAFDSQSEQGNWDIWTIGADGGSPSRLTLDPGDENMPSWSRDGRWIYFQSSQPGITITEVWRIPATGGSPEQVTHGGGSLAFESVDGKTLFFMREFWNAPLFALSLAGGSERKLTECVAAQAFAVGSSGVYHLACGADPSGTSLYLLDPETGRDRLLRRLEKASLGLTVSPDGKTVFYTRSVDQGADLMMIENFR